MTGSELKDLLRRRGRGSYYRIAYEMNAQYVKDNPDIIWKWTSDNFLDWRV